MTRFTHKMLLAGALGCLAAAGAAFASPVTTPQETVRFNRATLQTDAGARALYSRLAKAAEEVCPNRYSLLTSQLVTQCRQQAISGAVGRIHNQRLAALHAAETAG